MPDYRRKLPHFHPTGKYLFVTWRLWGSLPGKVSGPHWLNDPRIADFVAKAILIGDCERHFYGLRAWAVMPNHVHLLILPLVPVPVLMRWLKGSTARYANHILGRTGTPFWQDESFDHYLRDSSHLERAIAYVEENPVKAGLVCSAEQWRWSSAGWQAEPPAPPGIFLTST
jgi:REP element-mobilizing transposase RayT